MTHRGPFQPLPFCDSVILCFYDSVILMLMQSWGRSEERAQVLAVCSSVLEIIKFVLRIFQVWNICLTFLKPSEVSVDSQINPTLFWLNWQM